MKGWILDIYPDLKKGKMTIWLRTKRRCYKVLEEYDPCFYLRAEDGDYSDPREIYRQMGFDTELVKRKTDVYTEKRREVIKVSPGKVFDPRKQAGSLDFFEGYSRYEFYNVDIPLDQRYLIEKNIKPFSLVEKNNGWEKLENGNDVRYSKPPLRTVELSASVDTTDIPTFEDEVCAVTLGDRKIEGGEAEVVQGLNREIKTSDPDVIVTEGGDGFLIPYLAHRAKLMDIDLVLGREKKCHPPKDGESYHTYGKVVYKPPSYTLRGRIHIDKNSSFMYSEGGLDGLIDISRLSRIPVQRLCRRSPGAAINAVEVEEALKDGRLIPWKKNVTERFKTAEQLLMSDRGGYIFEPKVGLHEDVDKLDFASMYPTIIDRYNLSPETLGCKCGDHHEVPELGYRVCDRRRGLIPRVVAPLVERRQEYKRLSDGDDTFARRARALKWLLVTCFGYTGYKKARFSNIEVHESITAYGREILLTAADTAQEMGYEVIHGIVDSLWIKGDEERLSELIEKVGEETKVLLENEGHYSWVVFLPSRSDQEVGVPNRYYGKFNGEVEMKGIYGRRNDTPAFFSELQERILQRMTEGDSEAEIREALPSIMGMIKEAYQQLASGDAPLDKLYFTRSVSKRAEGYTSMTETKAALMQYEDMDVHLHPGQSIRYVVTDSNSRDHRKKVRIDGKEVEHYDRRYYERYLYRVAEEILIPFGLTEEKIKKKVKYDLD